MPLVRNGVVGLLALAILVGCGGAGSSAKFGSGLREVSATPDIEKQERQMFQRLNRDRRERGLPALRYDSKLADVARSHSADMRDNGFFAHESPTTGSLEDRLNAAGYLFLNARENLSEAPDVELGQDSLLKSPGHFANIVAKDITHIGIGVVRGGVEAPENLTITQVFARPGREESPAAARDALIGRIQSERRGRGLPRAQQHDLLQELADDHIDELDAATTPSSLQSVGSRINAAVSDVKDSGLRAVVVGAQLLPDSDSLVVPDALLRSRTAPYGLAVRKVSSESGRPMLQVLVIVGR